MAISVCSLCTRLLLPHQFLAERESFFPFSLDRFFFVFDCLWSLTSDVFFTLADPLSLSRVSLKKVFLNLFHLCLLQNTARCVASLRFLGTSLLNCCNYFFLLSLLWRPLSSLSDNCLSCASTSQILDLVRPLPFVMNCFLYHFGWNYPWFAMNVILPSRQNEFVFCISCHLFLCFVKLESHWTRNPITEYYRNNSLCVLHCWCHELLSSSIFWFIVVVNRFAGLFLFLTDKIFITLADLVLRPSIMNREFWLASSSSDIRSFLTIYFRFDELLFLIEAWIINSDHLFVF